MSSFCDLCGVNLPTAADAARIHYQGKNHLREAKRHAGNPRSVHVRGFTAGVTGSRNLHGYFSQFGKVEQVDIRPELGLAVVVFEDLSAREAALLRLIHLCNKDELMVAPSPPLPRHSPPPPQVSTTESHAPRPHQTRYCSVCDTRFSSEANYAIHMESAAHVAGLEEARLKERGFTVISAKLSQQNLTDHFSQYGALQNIVTYHQLNYAHVTFADAASRDAALAAPRHMVSGAPVVLEPTLLSRSRRKRQLSKRDKSTASTNAGYAKVYKKAAGKNEVAHQLNTVVQMMTLPKPNKVYRQKVVRRLEAELRNFIPEITLSMFGSVVTGLGSHLSDTDVFLDLDLNVTRGAFDMLPYPVPDLSLFPGLEVSQGMVTLASLMEQSTADTLAFLMTCVMSSKVSCWVTDIQPFPDAPVPSLTIHHKDHGRFCVHLGPRASLASAHTRLLSLLALQDHRFTHLTKIVRFWAWKVGLVSNELHLSLSNYALTLLVYFYLENTSPPVLPTVQGLADIQRPALSPSEASSRRVQGWDCGFSEDLEEIRSLLLPEKNEQRLPELVRGFFLFYANTDLYSKVICPRSGKLVDVLEFRKTMAEDERLADFMLADLHIQDVFALSSSVAGRLPQERARGRLSEALVGAAVSIMSAGDTWSLATFMPAKHPLPGMVSPPRGPPTFNFSPADLPLGFCVYGARAEAMWHQWAVELTLKALSVLRFQAEITGGYDREEELFPAGEYERPAWGDPGEEVVWEEGGKEEKEEEKEGEEEKEEEKEEEIEEDDGEPEGGTETGTDTNTSTTAPDTELPTANIEPPAADISATDIPAPRGTKRKRKHLNTNSPAADTDSPASDRRGTKRKILNTPETFPAPSAHAHPAVTYSAQRTVLEETLVKCRAFCRVWRDRAAVYARVPRSEYSDNLAYHEAVTRTMLADDPSARAKRQPHEFVLRIQRYRARHSTQLAFCIQSHRRPVTGLARLSLETLLQEMVGSALVSQ